MLNNLEYILCIIPIFAGIIFLSWLLALGYTHTYAKPYVIPNTIAAIEACLGVWLVWYTAKDDK